MLLLLCFSSPSRCLSLLSSLTFLLLPRQPLLADSPCLRLSPFAILCATWTPSFPPSFQLPKAALLLLSLTSPSLTALSPLIPVSIPLSFLLFLLFFH
ncbi:hypothetical protein EV1_020353 [Malus domestica]